MELAALLIPLAVLFTIGLVLHEQSRRERQISHWKALALARGLHHTPGTLFSSDALTGQVAGVSVLVDSVARRQGKHSRAYTRVRCMPAHGLPAGLHITPEGLGSALIKLAGAQDIAVGAPGLDARARISAKNAEDVRDLFSDPVLSIACMGLFSSSRFNRVDEGTVILEKLTEQGDEAAPLLEEALALCQHLSAARLRPWQQLAAAHPDLTLTEGHTMLALEGSWEGLPLQAQASLVEGLTEIRVPIPAPLPAGLAIVAGRQEGAVKLGDPVLDGAISVRGASSEAVRLLLRDDGLRGDLLSVLHAHPGSCVEKNTVVMRLSSASPPALAERLRDAGLLARALARRAPP